MIRWKSRTTKFYVTTIFSFVLAVGILLLTFSWCIENQVNQNIIKSMEKDISDQSYLFSTGLELQYQYLEAIAATLDVSDLLGENNLKVAKSLEKSTDLERTLLADVNGNARYCDGEQRNISDRLYFSEIMKGRIMISDPIISKIDGQSRIVLGVPIYDGDTVVGMLGGSYDLSALSKLLFDKVFYDTGYSLVVNEDGTIIALSGNHDSTTIDLEDNFFDYFDPYIKKYNAMDEIKNILHKKQGVYTITMESENGDGDYYLSCLSSGIGEWMICSIVPAVEAKQFYRFIKGYEMILFLVFILFSILLLLAFINIGRKKEKRLEREATLDSLTGVYNKKTMETKMVQRMIENERASGAMFIIDVDNFKKINDNYGHLTGDRILQHVGNELQSLFRDNDLLGRIGGDEFAAYINAEDIHRIALTRAQQLCEKIRSVDIEGVFVTVSIGIAFYPNDGMDYETLFKCADRALYRQKSKGRDGYSL